MRTRKIHRRTVLRGLGLTGIAIGLPPLEAMVNRRGLLHSAAQAQTAGGTSLPKRLVTFWWGNGAPMPEFTPAALGEGWQASPVLQGLSQVAEDSNFSALQDVCVLSGLHQPVNAKTHEQTTISSLTGVAAPSNETSAGISVDCLAGEKIGIYNKYWNTQIAVSTRPGAGNGRYSWKAAGVSVAPWTSPQDVFDKLFADYVADPEERARVAARRGSILDYVKNSIGWVQSQVGSEDRVRLDHHLTAIRELEQSTFASGAACEVPTRASDAESAASNIDLAQRSELMLKLAVMALRCDLTRVLNFSLQPTGENVISYAFLGAPRGDHDISHYTDPANAPATRDHYIANARWKISRFARLVQLLKDTPEGEGTLFDNCVTVGLSEMSWGGGHSASFLPVLAGGGGMKGGRHLLFPCAPDAGIYPQNPTVNDSYNYCTGGSTELSRLWLTALKAVGADVSSFGSATEPLSGLWAY